MKEETKKQMGSGAVGTGIGVGIGWLIWGRRKKSVGGVGVELSNLTYTYDQDNAVWIITVDATNKGTLVASVNVYINIGVVGWSSPMTLQPGEIQTVTQTVPISELMKFQEQPFVISAGINDIVVTPTFAWG